MPLRGVAAGAAQSFDTLVASRHSVRAYVPEPVPEALLQQILRSARQAPSGANLQPGAFVAVRGAARQRLTQSLVQAFRAGQQEQEDYAYFPQPMPAQLRRRQVAAARALYGALGLERADRAGRDLQFERNFAFFDAPVALLVTIERSFGSGGYMDLGMSLYGLMLAAQAHGLSSCAIGAMASYPQLIRRVLQLEDSQTLVCGLALGYADRCADVNRTLTARCELDDYFRVIE
jgi:nitroreductase